MRNALIIAAAFVAATPAAAQPASEPAAAALEQVDFGRVASVLERMVDVVLDVPVGGIAVAVDPLGHRTGIYPTDTAGSVANRADPGAERRLRAQIHGAARAAETASRAVARMLPALEQSWNQLRAGLAEAIDATRGE